MKYRVDLPLPPAKLSPNAAQSKARRFVTKTYKATCAALIRQKAKQENWPIPFSSKVVIHYEFYLCRPDNFAKIPKSRRPYLVYDEDNARGSCKAAQDALVVAGVLLNDSKDFCSVGETKIYSKASEHDGRTVLVMTLEFGED